VVRKLMLVLVLCGFIAGSPVRGQTYPEKPIRMAVGVPAGRPIDALARTVAPALGERSGRQVVIDSKPDADGNTAAAFLAKSAPNGYASFFASPGPITWAPGLFHKPPYDPGQLRALARSLSGKLMCATAGDATLTHLPMELPRSAANVDIRHVPYKT
jgi:tripartite-type tricarboxylate transporter receptor subunit TctC